jgi:hypothetical protein
MSSGRPGSSSSSLASASGSASTPWRQSRPRGVVVVHLDDALGEDRPGVEPRRGAVQGDARGRRPVGDGPVDRLWTAVERQRAGVDVEPAMPGDGQRLGPDDLVEAGHNRGVEVELLELLAGVLVVDPPVAEDGDLQVVGDPAQRVVAKDGRMCAGAGDDAAEVDVEVEQPEQEGEAVVARESREEQPGRVGAGGALRRAGGLGQHAVGDEAEALPGPQLLADVVEVRGGDGHRLLMLPG